MSQRSLTAVVRSLCQAACAAEQSDAEPLHAYAERNEQTKDLGDWKPR